MIKILNGIGWTTLVAVLWAGFMAYMVTSTDPVTHQMFDGLGRGLVESPWFMQVVFGQDRLWAGWIWFLGDFVWFFGGIFVGGLLGSYTPKKTNSGQN